jgi:hypothetical protein
LAAPEPTIWIELGKNLTRKKEVDMMYSDNSQWSAFSNPQPWAGLGQGSISQGAFGQGAFGTSLGGAPYAAGLNWAGPQRQLTQQDVGAILQQIVPVLPQIIAQAQQNQQYQQYHPMAAYGGGFGFNQRSLSPQDVSEVVRQLLPMIPQVLQSVQQQGAQAGFGWPTLGQAGGFGQQGLGWQGQAAYGAGPLQNPWHNYQQPQQRHFSHHDVNEIARQLTEAISQGYGGQPFGAQRM